METLKKYESKAQEEVPEEGDFGAISTKVMAEGKEMDEVSRGGESRVKGQSHIVRNVMVTGWKEKKKASQKLAGVTGGVGDETREEQASVPETREDRVPRSGMLNASEEKRKIKQDEAALP